MNIPLKELEGKRCYVCPCVMAVVGVLNGSRGPLFYPQDELARSAPHWNGRPVVVYHPSMMEGGVAAHPEVFNRRKVGTIFNARMDGQRLLADCWIDVERAETVDPRVIQSIYDQRMMEVSTGLFTDEDDTPGTYNGIAYNAVARAFRPDHLALLPDEIGACSIEDGAGLIRNELVHLEALHAPSW